MKGHKNRDSKVESQAKGDTMKLDRENILIRAINSDSPIAHWRDTVSHLIATSSIKWHDEQLLKNNSKMLKWRQVELRLKEIKELLESI